MSASLQTASLTVDLDEFLVDIPDSIETMHSVINGLLGQLPDESDDPLLNETIISLHIASTHSYKAQFAICGYVEDALSIKENSHAAQTRNEKPVSLDPRESRSARSIDATT